MWKRRIILNNIIKVNIYKLYYDSNYNNKYNVMNVCLCIAIIAV